MSAGKTREMLWLAAAVLTAAALAGWRWHGGALMERIAPLRHIEVTGGDDRSRAAVQAMLADAQDGNLLTMDMAAWRRRVEALPGVASARVARRLPDLLQVHIEPSAPLAKWHDGGLVDARGRRYEGRAQPGLPVFRGSAAAAQEMADFYTRAAPRLPEGIAQVQVDARGNWTVVMNDGVLLYLGREPRQRFERYARHVAAARRALPTLRAVDLRYEHGFAARVGAPATSGKG